MKSVLIIGAGRFGRHLAMKLKQLGNEIMLIDCNEDKIASVENDFSDSLIGDCCQDEVLQSVGVRNFDICFVAVRENFQASLEITSLLKELGAVWVVAVASHDRQAMLLKKIGADDVIYPEAEIAEKTAVKYSAKNLFDYIPLNDEYSMYEISVPVSWIGKQLCELDIRRKYQINIVAVKNDEELDPVPGGDYRFRHGDHIIAIATEERIERLQ